MNNSIENPTLIHSWIFLATNIRRIGHLGHRFDVGWLPVLDMSKGICLSLVLLIPSDVLQEQLWYACTSSSLSEVANVPRTEEANVPRKLPQVDKLAFCLFVII